MKITLNVKLETHFVLYQYCAGVTSLIDRSVCCVHLWQIFGVFRNGQTSMQGVALQIVSLYFPCKSNRKWILIYFDRLKRMITHLRFWMARIHITAFFFSSRCNSYCPLYQVLWHQHQWMCYHIRSEISVNICQSAHERERDWPENDKYDVVHMTIQYSYCITQKTPVNYRKSDVNRDLFVINPDLFVVLSTNKLI